MNLLLACRRSIRTLVREPGFTTVAVLTIGLGIGTATAVYSLAYAVLLRPYPYRDPDALVRVESRHITHGGALQGSSLPDVEDYRRRATTLEDIGAYFAFETQILGDGASEVATITQLNPAALNILGVQPVLGRLLQPEEDIAGGNVHNALISYSLWQSRFGADRNILGRALPTDRVNVQAFIGRQLSDGERQRVMLARALAQEPRLMILDEITAFLDLPRRVEIMHLLRELAHDAGHAVLLSTHDLELALRHADTVWLCAAGGQMTAGPPEELVWNGALADVFARDGLDFDMERGSFTTRHAHRGVVSVRGTGRYATWTGRALERLRFEVVGSPANGWPEVDVHVSGTQVSWTLRVGSTIRHVGTLTELLDRVRRETVDART